jgi:hypothetical protein avisC_09930
MLCVRGSVFFAAFTAILDKAGITRIEVNLGTVIRTGVILVIACVMVAVTGRLREVHTIPRGELGFGWALLAVFCVSFFAGVVVAVGKLSVVTAVLFSAFALQ